MTRLNKDMRKPIFIILIILGFILPILAHAALVTCGTSTTQECTLCDIFRMMQTIMNYIWWALLVIAPLFIIAGGVMILTAGIKPEQLESGKRIITGTVIGLAIAFLSWTILNVVFITLAKDPGQEGFPWPWNEIQCTGGGVAQTQPCTTDAQCSPPNTYCDWFGTSRCVTAENLVCELWVDCPSGYDCVGTGALGRCTGINANTNWYCYTQNSSGQSWISQQYNSEAACRNTDACPWYCSTGSSDCFTWCCLNQGNRDGEMNVCSSYVDQGWCRRTVPVNALSWRLSSYVQDPRQRGDASIELSQFLDCMFLHVPSLEINSISSNVLCTNPTCDTSTGNCGHTANSCHFGGTSPDCMGQSYAVDFNTNVACSVIRDAATGDCNFNTWFNYETDHVHVSVNNSACGCPESISGIMCPN